MRPDHHGHVAVGVGPQDPRPAPGQPGQHGQARVAVVVAGPDLARRDPDGYYFIVDRKKDMVIRGGYNIYPREIEEVLHEHPAVLEVAVVGIPHEELGEEVAAAVALRPGAVVTAEELQAFVRDRVAAYKYPRHVVVVDALPKGPTGKILKREVHITPAPMIKADL